uniref:Toll-like receptor 3 n=1 Tax=Gadus morhua TaxID=8049 RepID=A0A8C5CQ49_GADMO
MSAVCVSLGSCFCSFGILYFFLNSFIFPTASYTLNNCRVTQNTQAICQKNSFKVFPKDIPIESSTFVVQISLKVLILNNNRLCKLQEGMFDGLVNLIELRLTSNLIQTIAPASFKSLSKLKILDLGHNNLCHLTNVYLQHTPQLQNLYIPANKISTFHSWELSNKSTELDVLDLSQNELMYFRLTAGIFPKLKTRVVRLDISGTFNSSSLRYLQLNHINNSLQVLINVSCKNPKILDLGTNEITDISEHSFQSLRKLNTLIMKSNCLTSVPNAVRKTQIIKLDLSCNNINGLRCDDFANMTRLQGLYLYNNPLSALKDCVFKDLVNLHILMLQNSSIDQLNGAFKEYTLTHWSKSNG